MTANKSNNMTVYIETTLFNCPVEETFHTPCNVIKVFIGVVKCPNSFVHIVYIGEYYSYFTLVALSSISSNAQLSHYFCPYSLYRRIMLLYVSRGTPAEATIDRCRQLTTGDFCPRSVCPGVFKRTLVIMCVRRGPCRRSSRLLCVKCGLVGCTSLSQEPVEKKWGCCKEAAGTGLQRVLLIFWDTYFALMHSIPVNKLHFISLILLNSRNPLQSSHIPPGPPLPHRYGSPARTKTLSSRNPRRRAGITLNYGLNE